MIKPQSKKVYNAKYLKLQLGLIFRRYGIGTVR